MRCDQEILKDIIRRIEMRLVHYYHLDGAINACDFLMPAVNDSAECPPAGRVLVVHEEDLFVGIEFNEVTRDRLLNLVVEDGIQGDQLAALLIVIEEVSHFHLIVQRANAGLETSQLELEWQAEVVKMVVLSGFAGHRTFPHLLHQLHATLVNAFTLRPELSKASQSRYVEATRYFDHLWKKQLLPLLNENPAALPLHLDQPHIREHLRKLYWKSWQGKLETIAA